MPVSLVFHQTFNVRRLQGARRHSVPPWQAPGWRRPRPWGGDRDSAPASSSVCRASGARAERQEAHPAGNTTDPCPSRDEASGRQGATLRSEVASGDRDPVGQHGLSRRWPHPRPPSVRTAQGRKAGVSCCSGLSVPASTASTLMHPSSQPWAENTREACTCPERADVCGPLLPQQHRIQLSTQLRNARCYRQPRDNAGNSRARACTRGTGAVSMMGCRGCCPETIPRGD